VEGVICLGPRYFRPVADWTGAHSGHSPVSMSNIDGFIDKGEPPATLVDFLAELVRRFWT